MTGSRHDHDDGALERRKATLYCWECDHASPVDGDWNRRTRGRGVTYVCPDCETAITERPRSETADVEPRPLSAWTRAVGASASAWHASLGAGLAGVTALARDRQRTVRTSH